MEFEYQKSSKSLRGDTIVNRYKPLNSKQVAKLFVAFRLSYRSVFAEGNVVKTLQRHPFILPSMLMD